MLKYTTSESTCTAPYPISAIVYATWILAGKHASTVVSRYPHLRPASLEATLPKGILFQLISFHVTLFDLALLEADLV